jgi:hypothetical protein
MRFMSVIGRVSVLAIIMMLVVVLTSAIARAQDLDQGKSGAELFAATCAECHRSPRGLVKERFSWTLSLFLQQHYASSWTSARTLTAYLESVDAPRGKLPPGSRGSMPPAANASGWPPLRPPAPVPGR